ncbi:hypothetical protein HZF02_16960 [Pseudomonas yamanorum]|nr:hypothetical protein HZF02_16960 [Pseudomonas yamanorum]
MNIDKEKLKGLLQAETTSWNADCSEWKRTTEALDEFLGEKTIEEVALALLEENEALRKALGSCADELSAEVICKHGGQKLEDMHPVTRRLYERDMAPVIEAHAAMGRGEQS